MAHRTDRQRRSAAADDASERRTGRTAGSVDGAKERQNRPGFRRALAAAAVALTPTDDKQAPCKSGDLQNSASIAHERPCIRRAQRPADQIALRFGATG